MSSSPCSAVARRQNVKILTTCFSQTGNTAKVARAIYEAALSQDHEVHLKEIGEITSDSLAAYDLVFLGSACHDSDLAKPVKRVLERIDSSPPFKLAGFVTHAAYTPEGGEREREVYEVWASRCYLSFHQASQEKQIEFLGYFHCQGAPSPPIEAFIHNAIVTDEDEWETYIEEVRKHPDEQDLQKAREFARHVLVNY
jgi:flavodoxin